MWTCSGLKRRAKAVLSHTYGNSLGAVVIFFAIALGFSFVIGIFASIVILITMQGTISSASFSFSYSPSDLFSEISSGMMSVMAAAYIITLIAALLVIAPIKFGVDNFFLLNRSSAKNTDYTPLFYAFKNGRYGWMLRAILWFFFWGFIFGMPMSLCEAGAKFIPQYVSSYYVGMYFKVFFSLLTIPAAVLAVYKTISYSMTPFILSDNPKIGARRALRLSITMTKGHTGRIFLLALSFIGWILLGAVALGIGLLFVIPYIKATFTELYAQLRDNALKSGECTYRELNFADPAGPDAT
jgi:uncharacterized membrane protein